MHAVHYIITLHLNTPGNWKKTIYKSGGLKSEVKINKLQIKLN